MVIKLNGEDREVSEGTTVASLLDELKLIPRNVAVELNRRLLRAERYQTGLQAGDSLEIVTFVGGG